MVQDPNFWKRFSTAVHADDAAKEGSANLKHSYVPSQLSLAPASAPVLPPLSPSFSPIDYMQNLSVVSTSALAPTSSAPPKRKEEWEEHDPQPEPPSHENQEQEQKVKRQPSKLRKSPSTRSTRPLLSPSQPSSIPLPPPPPLAKSSVRCSSSLSLNLSGRPKANFRTWTTITANPATRDSWLQGQKRKSKQRTWICWCFWLGFILLVVGVVVTVLVLRAHGII